MSFILGTCICAMPPSFGSATQTSYERFLELCEDEKWNQALEKINKLLAKNKSDPDYLAGRARVYISLRRIRQAYIDSSNALKSNPMHFSALRRRGYCNMVLKRYDAGIKDLTVCINNGFGSDFEIVFPMKDCYNRGKGYELLKQTQKAKYDFKLDSMCKQLDKALDLRKSRQLKAGIETATNVIKSDKNLMLAYLVRGLLELNRGSNIAAINDFTVYLIKYPNVTQILYYRADAFMEEGKFQEAILDLDRILKLKPRLAAFDKTANTGRMREHFRYIDKNPVNMADICFLRGICFLSINKYAKAKSDFSKVIIMDPREWEAFYQRGNIWYHLKKYRLAISDFTKTLKLKQDFYRALIDRARAYEKLNDIDKAVRDLTTVVNNHKKEPGAFLLRGQLFERKKLFARAVRDYTQLIRLSPRDDDGYRCRADLYFVTGKYEKAISDYKRALSLSDEDKNVILDSIRKAKSKLQKH